MTGFVSQSTTLVEGHKIASGSNPDSPFEAGSIALQTPVFKSLGFDLSEYHPATLNLSVAPKQFRIIKPDHQFEHCSWTDKIPAESFSL